MKSVYSVDTWTQAKEALRSIDEERRRLMKEQGARESSKFLYRGHANAAWSLNTTLERTVDEPIAISDYYRHILKTRPQVEAFSDARWELMGLEEYTKWSETISDLQWPTFPGYEYMIYLRHHGFPSPLLDWSMSPYVAAFFAYRSASDTSEKVALYCYLETVSTGKTWDSSQAIITVKGPYARSHRRHFLQQCNYTICARMHNNVLCYVNHEEAFKLGNISQDLLWKIEIPRTTTAEALKDLDSMNVNALSLMGSEDALIETLATREYRLREA